MIVSFLCNEWIAAIINILESIFVVCISLFIKCILVSGLKLYISKTIPRVIRKDSDLRQPLTMTQCNIFYHPCFFIVCVNFSNHLDTLMLNVDSE